MKFHFKTLNTTEKLRANNLATLQAAIEYFLFVFMNENKFSRKVSVKTKFYI